MAKRTPEQSRAYYLQRQARLSATPEIPCACGCGTLIPSARSDGKRAEYSKGHNRTGGEFKPGQLPVNKGKPGPRPGSNAGKKLPPEQLIRRTATRLEQNGGVYQAKRGWQHTPEARARMAAAVRRRGLTGENNPFYGKTHSPETIAAMVRKKIGMHAGDRNPAWKGGISKEPYGPEFNRKFKQLILDRDGHRCRRCGRTAAEAGRPLHVHHLDHNKRNNDPANLVASCVSCNAWASHHRDQPFRL